jgi:small-conductance mechanosensitive channel/anti-sigma regulatory factor (Ser/Thr protein kinase)
LKPGYTTEAASTALLAILNHEFRVGELSLSLGGLLAFCLATWVAFWLARTIRALLAENVLPGLSLPRGVGNSISTLTYYTVLFLGLLSALAAAGFHVGQLALIFGALGVGIGFGLQDVVRNFVAGLILMFERPIQRGDTVEVTGMLGRVSEIGLRATTITTFEGADVVVPNGLLLADKLINWTLNGTSRRINLDFGIAYAVNPRQVAELLVEIARNVQGVAFSPAPTAVVLGFSDGVQDISLRAWTLEHTDWIQVRSELAMRVRDGLADAGIELVLPQRDLRVRRAGFESIATTVVVTARKAERMDLFLTEVAGRRDASLLASLGGPVGSLAPGDEGAVYVTRNEGRFLGRVYQRGAWSELAQDVAVLRIAQSALANTVRHAGATRVDVTLRYSGTHVALEIVDDGRGFDAENLPAPDHETGGFGLAAMRSRVRSLGGVLTIESAPGEGTVLTTQIPTAQNAASPETEAVSDR